MLISAGVCPVEHSPNKEFTAVYGKEKEADSDV